MYFNGLNEEPSTLSKYSQSFLNFFVDFLKLTLASTGQTVFGKKQFSISIEIKRPGDPP